MKVILILASLLFQQAAFAFPYRCISEEKIGDKPAINFKVNSKRDVNGWRMYLIGVTPGEGLRKIVYGQGHADEKGVAMTFVKDSFVLGSVQAYPDGNGNHTGVANLSGVYKNRTLNVTCMDLAESED